MKKIILILLISCNLGIEYIFSQTTLTFEEQKILNAFGDNGYYYYHSKDDTVIHAYGKGNCIEFIKYYLKKDGAITDGVSKRLDLNSFYFEINNNKVVSIIYDDEKMHIINITDSSRITDYLRNSFKTKLRKICGVYRDDKHKQTITLSESNENFHILVQKDDGTKKEDLFSNFYLDHINRRMYGDSYNYQLYFDSFGIALEDREKLFQLEQDDNYEAEYIFPFSYDKVSYFLTPSKISASSTLIEKNKSSDFYDVSNLIDNSWKSWVEGKNNDGIGEKLTFEFDKAVPIEKICIRNGYGDLRYYYKNNRIKTISVYINGNKINDFTLIDKFNCQNLSIRKDNVTKIEIEIKDVYPGTKYKDTCISEIYFIREFSVFSYDFPEFKYDDLTAESLSNFPHQEIIYPYELPKTLFYSEKGNPIMLYLSNPTYNWHAERFINLDFYIYDIKNRVWKTDNDNPIFANIKSKSDLAKQNNKLMSFYIDSFSDRMFNISEVGSFNFDGVKFFEPEEEPEPEYTGNQR